MTDCQRCGSEATSEITDAHGVRCCCELCSDAVFVMLMQPSIETFYQGEREHERIEA